MNISIYKLFIKNLLIFLLPVLLFLLFTEIMLRNYSNMYDQKRSNIEKRLSDIEVLILGNSQAVSGLNPEEMTSSAFNFAHDSQSLHYDMLTTEKYLPMLSKLKVVVIPISYFSLYYQLHHSSSSPRQYNYFFSYNIPLMHEKPLDIKQYSYIAAYSPRIAFGMVYLNKFKSPLQRESGFAPREGSLIHEDTRSMAFGLIARHNELIEKGNYMLNIRSLEHFVSTLNKKGIKTVFTSIPVSESYRKLQKADVLSSNRKAIECLGKKYGSYFIDLDSVVTLGDEFFSDIDHLNEKGADIVTLKLDSIMHSRQIISKK